MEEEVADYRRKHMYWKSLTWGQRSPKGLGYAATAKPPQTTRTVAADAYPELNEQVVTAARRMGPRWARSRKPVGRWVGNDAWEPPPFLGAQSAT